MRKPLSLVLAAMLVSGCALGPDYQAQAPTLPDSWPEQQATSTSDSVAEWQNWWTRFDDPVLNTLVASALNDNLSLQVQIHRVEQARAQLGFSRANRWPLLSAQAEASREQQPEMLVPGGAPGNQFVLAGALGYELDLWGRLSRQRESAEAQLAQSVYGAEAVRLNLVADVVTGYFNVLAVEQQYQLTEQTLYSRERTLTLEQARLEGGAGDPFRVSQAQAQLEATRALLPALKQQRELNRSALALLVGYTPEQLLGELDVGNRTLETVTIPQQLPQAMPSELLRRRPDVRAAEAGLMSATAQVGVAMAERWPSLNLNGLLGSVALDTDDLLTAPAETWRVGASLAGPLFDFGRGKARVRGAEAGKALAEAEYQLAIVSALRDARDALMIYQTTQERASAIQRQARAMGHTLALAELRYDEGAIGLYELLDAQRASMEAELALSQVTSQQLLAAATLFKAMGGGWDADTRLSAR